MRWLLIVSLFTLSVPLVFGALVMAGGSGAPTAPLPITVPLASLENSGVAGTASITTADDAATLTVEVTGLSADASYRLALHSGSCATPSASAGRLGALQADAAGRAHVTATSAGAAAAGVPVPLTLELLADGDHILVVTTPDRGAVACGAIPRGPTASK